MIFCHARRIWSKPLNRNEYNRDSCVLHGMSRWPAVMSAASAITQIGLSCLQHLASNERAVLARDAEGVHQMRVGLRPLRATMSLFGDIVKGHDTEALKGELKWLTEELGPARDLDVLAKEAIAPLRDANPDQSEIVVLDQDVKRKREDEFARASAAVANNRFRDLGLTAALWLLNGEWTHVKGASAKLRSESIVSVATDILDRRSQKIIKKMKRLRGLDAHQRHKARIAVKKFRYGCEYFDASPKADRLRNKISSKNSAETLYGRNAVQESEEACISMQRTAYPARVGAGKIAAGDQRIGCQRAALIGTQRLASPLRCLAVQGVQPGAGHRDFSYPNVPSTVRDR